MAWTQEEKDKLVKDYLDRKPTPETTTQIIKELAEETGQSANGVRVILSRAKAYVVKGSTPTTTTTTTEDKPKRVSKSDSIAALKNVIEEVGAEYDDTVVSKLTGKAAIYFTQVINIANGKNED